MRARTWAAVLAGILSAAGGCAHQRVDFTRVERVNTDSESSTGRQLEIDIVAVTKDDVKHDPRLNPRNPQINSLGWFLECEKAVKEGRQPFAIPREQIFRYTDRSDTYGVKYADALPGLAADEASRSIKPFEYAGPHVGLYVFARFQDERGNVSPTSPVVLEQPPPFSPGVVIEVNPHFLKLRSK